MTHRQYLAWQVWLTEDWNRPSRTDGYLRQISWDVRRTNAKHPGKVKYRDTFIPYGPAGQKRPRLTKEQATAASKAKWLPLIQAAGGVEVKEAGRDGSA